MESIISLHNPLIKNYLRLLKSRRFRQQHKKIAIEGPNLVREALCAEIVPEVLFFTEEYYSSPAGKWIASVSDSIRKIMLTTSLFMEITSAETPQAVAAIVPYTFNIENDPLKNNSNLVLIIDRLQDPGNMGTLIRTAVAAGVNLIYCTSGCVDPYSPKVLRSTAGAIFHVVLQEIGDDRVQILKLKERGFQLVAADADGDYPYWSAGFHPDVALIIGNEATGIADDLLKFADLSVSIPINASVDSLNAAVAAGIILFEINRRRLGH
jgi:RNA methyltransferase, TrmH family